MVTLGNRTEAIEMGEKALVGRERKCPICGKKYITQRGTGWLFKKQNYATGKTEYYCGYNCARKAGWNR